MPLNKAIRVCTPLVFIMLSGLSMILPAVGSTLQDDYFDLPPEQLLNAEVLSVSKKMQTVGDSPAAIFVLTNEDIIRSGVTNIPDALRLVPGVQVAQSDSNSWAISIRGFNSVLANKLLVLIDGRTIYNPVFGGVLWEAHDLMLEDVERIEVIRGPGGTLWGANAVNGVINIITKHSRETLDKIVSVSYGNQEQGEISLRQGGHFKEDGTYRIYAKSFSRDSSHKPNGEDAYDDWNGIRAGFRLDKGDEITFQGDAYRANTQQRRRHYSLVAPYTPIEEQTIRYEGLNFLGRWVDPHDNGSQFSLQSYLDWNRRDEPFNFIDNRIIFDIEGQYNFQPFGRHEIIAGSGFRFILDNEKGDNNVSFSPQGRRNSIYNIFVQDKIALVPKFLFLTIGSKLEHNEFSGLEIQPSAQLQYHIDNNKMIWGSVSRAVRTPTPLEEDLTSTLNTAAFVRAAFVPNENFHSETLVSYELGYRHQIFPNLAADFSGFYNDYKNLATTSLLPFYLVNNGVDPIHFFLPVQFRNDMRGHTHGIESVIKWTLDPDFKILAHYSYMQMSLHCDDLSEQALQDLFPVHSGGLRASWNINENILFDSGISYVGELKGSDVSDYVRLDINLGWKVNENITLNIVGNNLLDNAHREFGKENDINVGEVERSMFGKVTWKF